MPPLPQSSNTSSEIAKQLLAIKAWITESEPPESFVIVDALDSICKFADGGVKNKATLLSLGVIEIVMNLMISPDKSIKKSAVALIASSTDLNETIPENIRLVEILISILQTEDQVDILDEAAAALANIAKDFSRKVQIVKLGGVAALLKCMGLADPDVKWNVAAALSIVLDDWLGCRTELRSNDGHKLILDLLSSDFVEIQEAVLKCLAKASESAAERTEFKKLNTLQLLLEFLNVDRNQTLFSQTLTILAAYLDDRQSAVRFVELRGILLLAKLISHTDIQVKKRACIVLAKSLQIDAAQNMARESGIFGALVAQLTSTDPSLSSAAATAISALSQNDANMQELLRLGTFEILIKHIQGEQKEIKRESIAALASYVGNPRARSKFQTSPENLILLSKVLQSDDSRTFVNTCSCIISLCEDAGVRGELFKIGVFSTLLNSIELTDTKFQAAAFLCMSRFLHEIEAQTTLSKTPKAMPRIVSLLESSDVYVSRNAAYCLSIASRFDANAISACSSGAIEALLQLLKCNNKQSQNFASDALDKILNFNLPAKYWLLNHLSASNSITDGFYDIGFVGCNLGKVDGFPTIQKLSAQKLNTKREVILVDGTLDALISRLITFLAETMVGQTKETQIKLIAMAVVKAMGGPITKSEISTLNYKAGITNLKLNSNSNVVLLSQISTGTFYHRALLFKTLCDKLKFKPCILVRGEYNRAWNIVDVKNIVYEPLPVVKKATTSKSKNSSSSTMIPVSTVADQKMLYLGTADSVITEPYLSEKSCIVDLMFDPGKLITIDSQEALEYQRQYGGA